jgi:hypothetical protein
VGRDGERGWSVEAMCEEGNGLKEASLFSPSI